jgi:hypothetical protein
MKNDDEILETIINNGKIGPSLQFLLSKNESKETLLSSIASAAIIASYKARQRAIQTQIPFIEEIDGTLFLIEPNGEKRFIKKIQKSNKDFEQNFILD